MLNVKTLQAIRDKILGVTVDPSTYGDLNSVVYLQQILDAVKGTDPLNIRGNLAEHIYLQKILNAKRGVADGQFGSLPNSIYLQQLINAYNGVADGQFGSLPESSYLDAWLGVAGTTVPSIIYLLRDLFTTADAAPMTTPRTCEPTGTATIVDTTNILSIATGKLTFAAGGAAWADPAYFGSVVARVAGRAIILGAWRESTLGNAIIGFATSNAAGFNPAVLTNLVNNGNYGAYDGAVDNGQLQTAALLSRKINTDYGFCVVLRSAGAFILYKGVFTGATLANWTLLYPAHTNNTANVYPVVGGSLSDPVATLDTLSVIDLGTPWNTDYGICTSYAATAAINATQAHTADGWIEAKWTAATGATYELSVRESDADNRWIIRCDQGGSTIKLIERNATVETERASAAQTWTNGVAYRIKVRVTGNQITNWVNGTKKNDYALAAFNNTATIARTSLAVADFACYPWTLSGAALTAITNVE